MNNDTIQLIVQTFLAIAGAANLFLPLYQAWQRRNLVQPEGKKIEAEAEKAGKEALVTHAEASKTIVAASSDAVNLSQTIVANVRSDLEEMRGENSALKERLDKAEISIDEMRRNNIEEVARLRSEHNAEIASLRLSHAEEITRLRTDQNRELETMKRLYAHLLRRYKEDQIGISKLIKQLEDLGITPAWRPETSEGEAK